MWNLIKQGGGEGGRGRGGNLFGVKIIIVIQKNDGQVLNYVVLVGIDEEKELSLLQRKNEEDMINCIKNKGNREIKDNSEFNLDKCSSLIVLKVLIKWFFLFILFILYFVFSYVICFY